METKTSQNSAETLDSALARSNEAEERGDRLQAIRILQTEIPEQFAGEELAFIRSGEQLGRLKCFDEAEDVLRRGMETMPRSPWIARSYARVTGMRGDHTLALQRFTEVRDRFPNFSIGPADIVSSLIILGRAEEAEAVACEAKELFPDDEWVIHSHARAAEARGDSVAALERWRAVQSKWPDHSFALAGEVKSLCRLGRYAEANELLTSVGDRPIDPQLWVNAADLAEKAGAWSFAAAWWERFRTARPDDERGYVRGALALLRSGDTAAARALLELARVRWPDSAALGEVEREVTPPDSQEPAPSVPAKKPEPPRSGGLFGWLGW